MRRMHALALGLAIASACSGSQVPAPLPTPPVAAIVTGPAEEEPEVTWSIEPHVAVRGTIAADFFEGTLVVLTSSATIVVYRLAGDVVVATYRAGRRADAGVVVCGEGHCEVQIEDDAGGGGSGAYRVDLATGDVTDIGSGPSDWLEEHEPAARVADDGAQFVVETGGQQIVIPGIIGGGEHSIHGTTLHPHGQSVLIHQRAGVVLVRASGAREVACLDERSAAFTPDGTRVAQGEDGLCDPETDAGQLATAEPGYGSASYGGGYSSSYAATEPPPEPEWDAVCSPVDPGTCVRVPRDEARPLSLVVAGRARRLPGTADFGAVQFVADGSAVIVSDPTRIRAFEVPRGRERRAWRRDGVSLVEVLRDGSVVLGSDAGTFLLGPGDAETPIAAGRVAAEGITQHDDGGLYLCTATGLTVRDPGASTFRAVSAAPCDRVATLSTGLAVTQVGDGPERTVVSLADGHVVGRYGAPWTEGGAPLDAEWISRCPADGAPLEVLDIATVTSRTLGPCLTGVTYAADGSMYVRRSGRRTEMVRTGDGAVLELRVFRLQSDMVLVASTDDGAFWVPQAEDAALVDLTRREDGEIVETLRGDSERALSRYHRPTLLADFFEGHPLPRASE